MNSVTVETHPPVTLPADLAAQPGWPAPYAEGIQNSWIGELLTHLPLAMALLSPQGRLVVGNDAFYATVGQHCAPGTWPQSLVIADDEGAVAAAIAQALAGNETVEVRAALANRPDDRQMLTVTPVPPGLGFVALLALRDIREQLRQEAQAAAATRMQAVGQLAGGIAHDFNNILTAVLALTDQLLDRHPPGDEDHEALDEIRRNGNRAAEMIKQLLAFARQQPQRQQLLDLAEVIAGLQPLLGQLLGQNIRLHIDSDGLSGAVRADPGQIEQIIVNLAVNARDAMSGAGALSISVRDIPAAAIDGLGHRIIPRVDHVVIDVADTGTGIPPAIAGKIFEPFFTTKKMGEGTGLGLSTVYGIVKQSSGYIFARPGSERGTVFSIFLPAAGRRAGVSGPDVAAPQRALRSLDGLRVLLVEDEPAVRMVLKRALARQGLRVEVAADGQAALALLDDGLAIDVLVSDVMMPGIDGVDLAARAVRQQPGLAVVLMSGFAELPLHRAADAQGVEFLSKPFAMTDLTGAIATAYDASLAESATSST